MTEVSNPYLSQLGRGLHQPSVRVLKSIADALNVSAETLVQAGLLEGAGRGRATARLLTRAAIRIDPVLSDDQKEALINVYRAMAHDRRSAERQLAPPARPRGAAARSRPGKRAPAPAPRWDHHRGAGVDQPADHRRGDHPDLGGGEHVAVAPLAQGRLGQPGQRRREHRPQGQAGQGVGDGGERRGRGPGTAPPPPAAGTRRPARARTSRRASGMASRPR